MFSTEKFDQIIILSKNVVPEDLIRLKIPFKLVNKQKYFIERLFKYKKVFFLDLNEHIIFSLFIRGFSAGLIYRYKTNNKLTSFILHCIFFVMRIKKINIYVLNFEYAKYLKIPKYIKVVPELQKYDLNIINDEPPFLLHYGALSIRKGTSDIIKASKSVKNGNIVFIGNLDDTINDFDKTYIKSQDSSITHHKYNLEILQEMLANCCGILAPYTNVDQSSAIVEVAISLNIPLLTYKGGFIGYRCDSYNLGVIVEKNKLSEAIDELLIKNKRTCIDKFDNEAIFLKAITSC
ncbi:MAG: hypothetical protein ACI93P_000288 [bacterium]|jgi:hypothetical protein